jgi:NOL1/NOP2/sun family putative RNA methylase
VSGLEAFLEKEGLPFRASAWHPWARLVASDARVGATLEYIKGQYHIQEEIALAAVLALDPRPGEKILDLCAAPGNKTALAAVTMKNTGTVVANDIYADRLSALRFNLERMGILNALVTQYNGSGFPMKSGPFDRVMVDVPCSCEGTARRSKGATSPVGPKVRQKLSRTQGHILTRALALTKPGGRLVYATCTFAPEENEGVLTDVLGDKADIIPFDVEGLAGHPGVTQWEGRLHRPDVVNARRYLPQDNDTGGFFVARVEVRA